MLHLLITECMKRHVGRGGISLCCHFPYLIAASALLDPSDTEWTGNRKLETNNIYDDFLFLSKSRPMNNRIIAPNDNCSLKEDSSMDTEQIPATHASKSPQIQVNIFLLLQERSLKVSFSR